jgi:hypothetical protein
MADVYPKKGEKQVAAIMIKYIEDIAEYNLIYSHSAELVVQGASLPDYVFGHRFQWIRIVDYNRILTKDFISILLKFARLNFSKMVWYVMLEPHPKEFYYRNFKRFGVLGFDVNESAEDIYSSFWEAPNDNWGDSLLITNTKFILFAEGCGWCIWGERGCDAGLIAFEDKKDLDLFAAAVKSHGVDWLETPKEALDGTLTMSFRRKVPDEFREKFIENYVVKH